MSALRSHPTCFTWPNADSVSKPWALANASVARLGRTSGEETPDLLSLIQIRSVLSNHWCADLGVGHVLDEQRRKAQTQRGPFNVMPRTELAWPPISSFFMIIGKKWWQCPIVRPRAELDCLLWEYSSKGPSIHPRRCRSREEECCPFPKCPGWLQYGCCPKPHILRIRPECRLLQRLLGQAAEGRDE